MKDHRFKFAEGEEVTALYYGVVTERITQLNRRDAYIVKFTTREGTAHFKRFQEAELSTAASLNDNVVALRGVAA